MVFAKSNNQQNHRVQLDLPKEEIKTALQLQIFSQEKRDGTTYFIIRTWLVDEPSQISDPIARRYNDFDALNEKLVKEGYPQLPVLPRKRIKLLMTDDNLFERQNGLQQYLRELVNRTDTRNSRHVVQFLNLHEFCPEIIYNVPILLIKKEFSRNRQYVNSCLFLEQHKLYVISITDKSSKQSRFEIYSFRQTGLIQD